MVQILYFQFGPSLLLDRPWS